MRWLSLWIMLAIYVGSYLAGDTIYESVPTWWERDYRQDSRDRLPSASRAYRVPPSYHRVLCRNQNRLEGRIPSLLGKGLRHSREDALAVSGVNVTGTACKVHDPPARRKIVIFSSRDNNRQREFFACRDVSRRIYYLIGKSNVQPARNKHDQRKI